MRRTTLAHLALAGASLLYGVTFVVVKDAIESLPPFNFIGWRFLLGAVLLVVVGRPRTAGVWRDGLLAGVVLFAGYGFQTEGLLRTGPANSGLITGLYVVLTPLMVAGLARRTIDLRVLAGTIAAFIGFALLTEGFSPRAGDLLTVACAIAFALHIVLLTHMAPRHSPVGFTAVQLLTTAILAFGTAAVREGLFRPPSPVVPALLLTGLAVSAGGFLLQVWAQRVVGASRTAVVLALEPAFAVGFAALWAGERLTGRGWAGAGLILAAIYVVLATEERDLPAAEAVSAAH